MSKIPIKRMYDVIAELQNESSSASASQTKQNHTTPTTCSQLAAALLANLPNKKVRVSQKEELKQTTTTTTTTTTVKTKSDDDATKDAHVETSSSQTKEERTKLRNNVSYDSHIRHIPEAIANVRGVYLYGLQTVSALQDMQYVPDAILPGNLVSEEEYEVATVKKEQ